MRRLSREAWLTAALVVVLLLLTAGAAFYQTRRQAQAPALSSDSSAPDGARALWLWLEELGHTVSDEVAATFGPPPDASVVLVLEPAMSIDAQEWQTLDEWVDGGGTLVLAGEHVFTAFAVRHYDFEMEYSGATLTPTLQAPLMTSPPLTSTTHVRPRSYLKTDRMDTVIHLAAASEPVLVSFEQGAGRVILSSAAYPFTNAGLKRQGNPELVLNVVTAAKRSGTIWFDEWHHGRRGAEADITGPTDWLRQTPAGRALLYSAAVVFLALLLQGRRLGRPMPLPSRVARRTPLEHITAIANLNRRAGHRQAVLEYHRRRLKRGLGKRYRLEPTLPDDEYVDRLACLNPDLDADALRNLLARLRRRSVGESEMIQLAAEVAAWLKE